MVVVSSLLAGAAMPSIGPMVRARWSALLAGTTPLHTAFSLESVADEIIFMAGPVIVALLATDVYPAAGLAAALLLCLVGTVLFTAQRRTEPPPRPRAGGVTSPAGSLPARARAARRPRAAELATLVPCTPCWVPCSRPSN